MTTDPRTGLAIVERDAAAIEFVEVDVTASADPLGDAVMVGLRPARELVTVWLDSTEWAPGQEWVAGKPVRARVLVGPGKAMALQPGARYDVRVQLADATETPVFTAYHLLGV